MIYLKWFALLGLLLFLGVAVAPSITADVREPEPISIEEKEFEKLFGLVEGIVYYIENNYGPIPDKDCGCSITNSTWRYPVFCTFLFFLYFFTGMLVALDLDFAFLMNISTEFMQYFGPRLNCWWV